MYGKQEKTKETQRLRHGGQRRHKRLHRRFKDVRAKIFQSIEFFNFFKILLQAENELLVPEMQKKLGVTVFVSEIKRVVNYTDFEKLSHLIEHGLQRFKVKNIEGDSKEANDLNHIL